MKFGKRIISAMLTSTFLLTVLPTQAIVLAVNAVDSASTYSIKNDYLTYSVNTETGGFSIETIEGHPQKELDNNIPLLYKDDLEQSVHTSFTTVRIDGEDYIFGRDYGFWSINSELQTPVVGDGGQSLTTVWTIKGYEITQTAAISIDDGEIQTGTIGLSYSVKNTNGTAGDVSIRVLLDTALSNDTDAPYLTPITISADGSADMGDTILTETVFEDEEIPTQIRGLDSQTAPTQASYLIFSEAINQEIVPDKVAVAHWANLANTRYDFTPDTFCDFSNFSNEYRTPDAAVALYWEDMTVSAGEDKVLSEVLYGVGDFDLSLLDEKLGLSSVVEGKITLNSTGTDYENDEFSVLVTLDNSVDNALYLEDVTITPVMETGVSIKAGTASTFSYEEIAVGDIKDVAFAFEVAESQQITAKSVTIGVVGTAKDLEAGTQSSATYSTTVNILLPGVGTSTVAKINEMAPSTVYTEGTKTFTISGEMSALKALDATDDWTLQLVSTSGVTYTMPKSKISFLNDNYTSLMFSTDESLAIGEYSAVFNFQDQDLISALGTSIKSTVTVEVSDDEQYKVRTYGIMVLARIRDQEGSTSAQYDYFAFDTEAQYRDFYEGEAATGLYNGSNKAKEILLVVRGAIREAENTNGTKYYSASHSEADITINDMLTYTGESPLTIQREEESTGKYSYKVAGDGLLQVVNSIKVWSDKWSFTANESASDQYSIRGDGIALTMQMDGIGYMLQSIAGFLIEMKFGELTAEEVDVPVEGSTTGETEEYTAYGISFGGTISLPIKSLSSSSDESTEDGAAATTTDDDDDAIIVDTTESAVRQTDTDSSSGGDDDDDYSDAFSNMFDEDASNDDTSTSGESSSESGGGESGDGSGDASGGDSSAPSAASSSIDPGNLSAEIEDIIYGQDPDDLADIGFVGINTTVSLSLPQDLLGTLVTNAAGVGVSMQINTLDHYYALEAALSLKNVISCEGSLAFKMTEVGGSEIILPDKITFYIRDGLMIPVPPPASPFNITGLGGGIDELADTIGGEFTTLPPLTLLLGMNMEVVEVLKGQVDASINASGFTLVGKIELATTTTSSSDSSTSSSTSPVEISSIITAQWVDPMSLNMTGTISVIGGLLQGTLSVTIKESYFAGYSYVRIAIPDDIPIVGGKEIAGVEAAISNTFIGANLKILSLSYGVLYYWDGDFNFGTDIDLASLVSAGDIEDDKIELSSGFAVFDESDGVTKYYGTNIHELQSTSSGRTISLMSGTQPDATVEIPDVTGVDSLLFTVPLSGGVKPLVSEITVKNPSGETIELITENGDGNGTFMLQEYSDGSVVFYVSVVDSSKVESGTWEFYVDSTESISLDSNNIQVSAVSNIPELATTSYVQNDFDIEAQWTTTNNSETSGTVEFYLTEDKDVLTKVQSASTNTSLGTKIGSLELDDVESGTYSMTLPESFANGTYYLVTTLSVATGGMSSSVSAQPFVFTNDNLPKSIEDVKLIYAGDGEFFVKITDAQEPDYTHYIVELLNEDGTGTGIVNQYAVGDEIYMGKASTISTFDIDGNAFTTDIDGAVAGQKYGVQVRTLREEDVIENALEVTKYYYGSDLVVSAENTTMQEISAPTLVNWESNIEGNITSESKLINTYTFIEPVWMIWEVNGLTQTVGEFKETWEIEYDLIDGKYVTDFKVYSKSKDTATAADFDAQQGFEVDTLAPVLNLVQEVNEDAVSLEKDSLATEFVISSNTVVADSDGKYTINGLSEANTTLTVNGNQATINSDGSFSYVGYLSGETKLELTLIATDKAGNQNSITAFVLNNSMSTLENIKLYRSNNGVLEEITDQTLSVGTYEEVVLVAQGIDADGNIVTFDSDSVYWSVLYEKNLISFNEGTAISYGNEGETAIKAYIRNGIFTDSEGAQSMAVMEDYIILEIAQSEEKEALNTAILEAQASIADPQDATTAEIEAFQAVIDEAIALSTDYTATDAEIAQMTQTLTAAMTTFDEAKEEETTSGDTSGGGTTSGGSVSGGSTTTTTTTTTEETVFVTVDSSENGVASSSHSEVTAGTSVTITATPDDSYEVGSITVNGQFYTNDSQFTLSTLSEDVEVYVNFVPTWEGTFEDVAISDWYYNAVRYVNQQGYMMGMSDTEFEPDVSVTRGMLVTIMGRMAGADITGLTSDFDDVSNDMYYAPYVAWATNVGVSNGVGNNMFEPDREITRDEMATMIYRYLQLVCDDIASTDGYTISFIDAASIPDWAQEAVAYLSMQNVISGKTNGSFDPFGLATRAEIATVIRGLDRISN